MAILSLIIRATLITLIKVCAKPESRGKTLESYLITPIQRIPRYLLLLLELQKHTEADHPRMPQLQEAIQVTNPYLL